MYIALEKKKTNVIEYVLYMWQVENIIRACKFDVNKIEQTVINHLGLNENEKALSNSPTSSCIFAKAKLRLHRQF